MGSFEAEGNEGFGVSVSVSLSRGPIRNLTTLTARTGYLYTGCAWRTVGALASFPSHHDTDDRRKTCPELFSTISLIHILSNKNLSKFYVSNKLVTLRCLSNFMRYLFTHKNSL